MSQPMIVRCPYDALVPIAELKPNPENRNEHPPEQIKRLAEILAFQGFRHLVTVSKRSGLVVSGHGRIEAAKLNGWPTVPVSYQDYDSDEMEYADAIADNAIASWAELNMSDVNSDVGDLGPDFNIDLLGIEHFKIDVNENTTNTNNRIIDENKFIIAIECENEKHQQELFEKYVSEGLKCKLIM